jgi:hypothetical protein
MASSIDRDPCENEINNLLSVIIVLVSKKLESFVRKILQREENKGVKLTACRWGAKMHMLGGLGEDLDVSNRTPAA